LPPCAGAAEDGAYAFLLIGLLLIIYLR